ncbi:MULTISPECIES: HNH endonuclease family protein [Enterobacter]|uniref:hypothetical protein n=1 Tax=Enterobacter TaxID=547 RepID=UPI00073BD3C8|nr:MULTISPECIES: hypothetical protein [Enterobacter]EKS6929059.1 hypothetical protein [Enterobacter bugandensis]EKV5172069.1 hypothetical protein [Enterobacter bugandensis]KSX61343.1 hypothetical protein APT89_14410 [Enterobacter sp. 50588862]MDX7473774.1 hypothetical protein [Enterobacter bugandensis]
MYPFTRPECPDYLLECWEELGSRYEESKRKDAKYTFCWYAAFRYEDTRKLLTAMTQEHCAFCDGGDLGAMSRETLEHFRPKSREEFYRLAYQWENLYPCCDRCQSEKLEKYEDALLIADVAGFVFNDYFMVDYLTGEILPNSKASAANQHRAERTIEIYGLNVDQRKTIRKKELKRYLQRDEKTDVLDDFSYRYFLMDA